MKCILKYDDNNIDDYDDDFLYIISCHFFFQYSHVISMEPWITNKIFLNYKSCTYYYFIGNHLQYS